MNKNIDDLTNDINSKKNYFDSLQDEATSFLSKLNETYLADYVDNKIILKDFHINEDNIKFIFDNIQNYTKLITEFERKKEKKIYQITTKTLIN